MNSNLQAMPLLKLAGTLCLGFMMGVVLVLMTIKGLSLLGGLFFEFSAISN